MPEPRFERLRTELLDGGVAPDCVENLLAELHDHFADLELDALEAGCSRAEAVAAAWSALGSEDSIVAAALCRPELMTWPHRWPRTASCVRSALFLALLPSVPVLYCVHRGPVICRWGVSACLASLITALLFFVMQLALY